MSMTRKGPGSTLWPFPGPELWPAGGMTPSSSSRAPLIQEVVWSRAPERRSSHEVIQIGAVPEQIGSRGLQGADW